MLKSGPTFLIALAIGISVGFSAEAQQRDIVDLAPWNSTGNSFEDLVRPREPALLQDYPQVFVRDRSSLVVTLTNGEKLYLTDGIADAGEVDRMYGLYGYDPRTGIVEIITGYPETVHALLFDRATGHHINVDSVPHISPDGNRWAVVVTDDNSANIQIAELTGGGLTLVGDNLSFEGDVCKFEKWETNDAFSFTCLRLADLLSQQQIAQRDASGKWRTSPVGPLTSDKSLDWYGSLP